MPNILIYASVFHVKMLVYICGPSIYQDVGRSDNNVPNRVSGQAQPCGTRDKIQGLKLNSMSSDPMNKLTGSKV